MASFDYEISDLTRSIRSLAENIAHSAVQEAINIAMTNSHSNILTNNMDAQNIQTNNLKSTSVSSQSINSNISFLGDSYIDMAVIKRCLEIQGENSDLKLNLNDKGIFSIINDNKNALVMLETIKNLLIEANYFTEEKFDKEYTKVEQKIEDIINGEKVAKKLMENPNKGVI
jgi:hypothetical protein